MDVFLQELGSNLMADLFWSPQKWRVSIFYVHILKIIWGGIYFISMIFTSYCAEILVWQLKYFCWTEANVKSGSVNRHSQRVCLEFHNTSKSCKFPGWERSENSHGYNTVWQCQWKFCCHVSTLHLKVQNYKDRWYRSVFFPVLHKKQ